MNIELEQEDDQRWIGEVTDLPGVLAYGKTREEAFANAKALALRVLADRIEHGESRWRYRRANETQWQSLRTKKL